MSTENEVKGERREMGLSGKKKVEKGGKRRGEEER